MAKLTRDPPMTILPVPPLPAPAPGAPPALPGSLHFHIGYPERPQPAQPAPALAPAAKVDPDPPIKSRPIPVGDPHKRAKDNVEKWRMDQQAAAAAALAEAKAAEQKELFKGKEKEQDELNEVNIVNIPSVLPEAKVPTILGIARPHPLLWVCLALSVLALVLGVPKGTLPTITGRHKALRVSSYAITLFSPFAILSIKSVLRRKPGSRKAPGRTVRPPILFVLAPPSASGADHNPGANRLQRSRRSSGRFNSKLEVLDCPLREQLW